MNVIERAKSKGYEIVLLFLALESVKLAIERVAIRVQEGGHGIPRDTIIRRYETGLKNLFKLYMPIVDKWILVDNSSEEFEFIAEGAKNELIIRSEKKWSNLKKEYCGG